MTVQEVKEQIQEYDKVAGLMMNIPHDVCMAIIESLSELEQYRAFGTPTQILERIGGLDVELGKYHCLGTVEELKEAREKQIPMKIKEIHVDEYYCPACGAELNCNDAKVQDKYCSECGQRFEVGEEDD